MAYTVTECFYLLKNMWTQPEYKKLVFSVKAWIKIHAYINLIGEYEISGFGRIQPDKEDPTIAHILDVDIIEQEVKSAYVESKVDSVLDFIRQIPKEQRNEWVLDWHSHVNMGTTPSATDWSNYQEMLTARMGKQFPFIIINKESQVTAKQYISQSKAPSLEVSYIQEQPSDEQLREWYDECKEKVERLCTKYTAPATSTTSSWGSNWYSKGSNQSVWYGNSYYEDDDDDYDDVYLKKNKIATKTSNMLTKNTTSKTKKTKKW